MRSAVTSITNKINRLDAQASLIPAADDEDTWERLVIIDQKFENEIEKLAQTPATNTPADARTKALLCRQLASRGWDTDMLEDLLWSIVDDLADTPVRARC